MQVGSWTQAEVTELRYAVEVEIPRSTHMVGLLEPLLEQAVYEDIPTNLRAVKLRVEQLQAQGDSCLPYPESVEFCGTWLSYCQHSSHSTPR